MDPFDDSDLFDLSLWSYPLTPQDQDALTTFPTPHPEETESLYRQLSEFVRPSGKRPAAPLPAAFDLGEDSTPFDDDGRQTPADGDHTDAEGDRPRKRSKLGDDQGAEEAAADANGEGGKHTGKRPGKGGPGGRSVKTRGGPATAAAAAATAAAAEEEGEGDDDTPLAVTSRPELDDKERQRRAEIKEKERLREEKVQRRGADEQAVQDEKDVQVQEWHGIELPQLPLRPAALEQLNSEIILPVVTSRNPSPVASILLIGLKNLFQKQLPKMPREYITRLVLDKNHISKAHPTINHFLTYADNYAVGYFKKQGFSKEITYPRERWVGYIKDYEGGTIMQCCMLPKVKYSEVHQMLSDQKAVSTAPSSRKLSS